MLWGIFIGICIGLLAVFLPRVYTYRLCFFLFLLGTVLQYQMNNTSWIVSECYIDSSLFGMLYLLDAFQTSKKGLSLESDFYNCTTAPTIQ